MKKQHIWRLTAVIVAVGAVVVSYFAKEAYRNHIIKTAKEEWTVRLTDNREDFDYIAEKLNAADTKNRKCYIELSDTVSMQDLKPEEIPEYDKLEAAFQRIRKTGVNNIIHSEGNWVFVDHHYKNPAEAKKKDGAFHDEGVVYSETALGKKDALIYDNWYFTYADYYNKASWLHAYFYE